MMGAVQERAALRSRSVASMPASTRAFRRALYAHVSAPLLRFCTVSWKRTDRMAAVREDLYPRLDTRALCERNCDPFRRSLRMTHDVKFGTRAHKRGARPRGNGSRAIKCTAVDSERTWSHTQ